MAVRHREWLAGIRIIASQAGSSRRLDIVIEIPEAQTLAHQMRDCFVGKKILTTVAAQSPHGFAFYLGDPLSYASLLDGVTITGAEAHGGRPELQAEDICLSFGEGVNVRMYNSEASLPKKHQLLLGFDDGRFLCCTIQMYGSMEAFLEGTNENFYYLVGKEKISVLSDEFDLAYFQSLLDDEARKGSAKAFLATQQRIPGLGNGVVQDILWQAGIHPKAKMSNLSEADVERLYNQVKTVLADMTNAGGRHTEKDLYGNPGGYQVVLCKDAIGQPCPRCGTIIQRMAYLGGNVYVCEGCQKL